MADPIITSELTIQPLKPGYRTTEGAAAIVGVLAPLAAAVVGSSALQANPWALVALIGIIAAVAIAYIFARTWLKRGAAAMVLLLLLLGLPARAEGLAGGDVTTSAAVRDVVLPRDALMPPAAATDPRIPPCPPAPAAVEPRWLTTLRISIESALATAASTIAVVELVRGVP